MAKIKLSEEAATVVRDDVPEGLHPALIAGVDDTAFDDPKVSRLTVQFTITGGLYKGISVYRSYRLRDRGDYESLVSLARTCSLVAGDAAFDSDELVGHEVILELRRKQRSWQDRMTGKPVTRAFPIVASVAAIDTEDVGDGEDPTAGAGAAAPTEAENPQTRTRGRRAR